jgi:methylase of polypeptide subunit release factors
MPVTGGIAPTPLTVLRAANVLGIDFNKEAINHARQNNGIKDIVLLIYG